MVFLMWKGHNPNEIENYRKIVLGRIYSLRNKKSVLNIGDTNSSFVTSSLRTRGFDVTTVDVFDDADVSINMDGKKFSNELEKRYDVVIVSEVLEHIVHTDAFMAEAKKCLLPDGTLVLSVPNICCLKNRFKLLFGKFPTYGCTRLGINPAISSGDNFHVRDFNVDILKLCLSKHGFVIDEMLSSGVFVRDRKIVPHWLCTAGLGDHIIVVARLPP